MGDRGDDLASLLGLSRDELELALQSGEVSLWEVDYEHDRTWYSPNHPILFGLEHAPPDFIANAFLEFVVPEDRARVAALIEEAMERAATLEFECAIRDARGDRRSIKAVCRLVRDDRGRILRSFGSIHDTTTRKLAQAALQGSVPRLRLLADLADALGRQKSFHDTVDTFAHQVVAAFGDACLVDLAAGGAHRRAATAHRLPAKQALLLQLAERHPPIGGADHPVSAALRTGRPVLFNTVEETRDALSLQRRGPEYAAAVRALGIRSGIVVPFVFGDAPAGAVVYLVTESDAGFSGADLRFAEEVTRRGGIAFERALLHGRTEEALRARDSLISTSSHELMTPVTTMRLLVDSMKKALAAEADVDRAKVQRMVDVTDRAIRRLQRLVADMLDVSRLTAGKLSLQTEPMDLSEAVAEAIERLRDKLDSQLVAVRVRLAAPLRGVWDRDRVDQIVTNLLTNVLRYAPGSEVTVATGVAEGMAEVSVADTGPGIARGDHDRIFQKFERVLLPGDGTGLGLGLFIARQLVERHGGKIWVESDAGAGARFVVRLPLP